MDVSELSNRSRYVLFQAAVDFFFLQNRGYPRSTSLEWVGNRYTLTKADRQLLLRGVFSQQEALQRRAKRSKGAQWQENLLVVDGHNVHITVESALLERPLLIANDGALRDIAGQSAQFRLSEVSRMAIDVIFRLLEEFPPERMVFLFDAPMSHSGELASLYRQRMESAGLSGEARAVPVPEHDILYEECVVASSDHVVLDKSRLWLDLARAAIDAAGIAEPLVDFTAFITSKPGGERLEELDYERWLA